MREMTLKEIAEYYRVPYNDLINATCGGHRRSRNSKYDPEIYRDALMKMYERRIDCAQETLSNLYAMVRNVELAGRIDDA